MTGLTTPMPNFLTILQAASLFDRKSHNNEFEVADRRYPEIIMLYYPMNEFVTVITRKNDLYRPYRLKKRHVPEFFIHDDEVIYKFNNFFSVHYHAESDYIEAKCLVYGKEHRMSIGKIDRMTGYIVQVQVGNETLTYHYGYDGLLKHLSFNNKDDKDRQNRIDKFNKDHQLSKYEAKYDFEDKMMNMSFTNSNGYGYINGTHGHFFMKDIQIEGYFFNYDHSLNFTMDGAIKFDTPINSFARLKHFWSHHRFTLKDEQLMFASQDILRVEYSNATSDFTMKIYHPHSKAFLNNINIYPHHINLHSTTGTNLTYINNTAEHKLIIEDKDESLEFNGPHSLSLVDRQHAVGIRASERSDLHQLHCKNFEREPYIITVYNSGWRLDQGFISAEKMYDVILITNNSDYLLKINVTGKIFSKPEDDYLSWGYFFFQDNHNYYKSNNYVRFIHDVIEFKYDKLIFTYDSANNEVFVGHNSVGYHSDGTLFTTCGNINAFAKVDKHKTITSMEARSRKQSIKVISDNQINVIYDNGVAEDRFSLSMKDEGKQLTVHGTYIAIFSPNIHSSPPHF